MYRVTSADSKWSIVRNGRYGNAKGHWPLAKTIWVCLFSRVPVVGWFYLKTKRKTTMLGSPGKRKRSPYRSSTNRREDVLHSSRKHTDLMRRKARAMFNPLARPPAELVSPPFCLFCFLVCFVFRSFNYGGFIFLYGGGALYLQVPKKECPLYSHGHWGV